MMTRSMLLLLLAVPFSFYSQGVRAGCVTTIVSGGGGEWVRLFCDSANTRDLLTWARYVESGVSIGRLASGIPARFSNQTWNSLNSEQKCDTLEANKPKDCNKGEYKDLSPNGCTIAPGKLGNVDFRSACNKHDNCYSALGGGNSQRARCDHVFRHHLNQACDARYGPAKIYRFGVPIYNPRTLACQDVIAAIYHGAVVELGQPFFDQAQKDAKCNDWNNLLEQNSCV